jgi:hypothetical protein
MKQYTDYSGITLAETQRQLLVARKSSIRQSEQLALALKEKNDLANQGIGLKVAAIRAECDQLWRSRVDGLKLQRDDLQARYDELVRRMGENLYYNLASQFYNPSMLMSPVATVPEPAKPKFRVGQYVMVLQNNPKWDSANGEPYRIDREVVRITRVEPAIAPPKSASKFVYTHSGKEGNYLIPEVWFRILREDEITGTF